MPVLITAGLSPEAWRLHRVLDMKEVVFADESQLPHIPGIMSVVLPPCNSASYIHETLKACLDHNINCVYPLKRGEIMELSKARALYSEYSISLMIPSDDWLRNNPGQVMSKGDNIVVLEKGGLKAGIMPPEDIFIKEETGIFSWATIGQQTQYSLYIV